MYEKHRVFEEIESEKKIWRYMDISKFLSLLEDKALFFTRADRFNDKFEGSYTKVNIEGTPTSESSITDEEYKNLINTLVPFSNINRKFNFINCWHINEYESEAMWNLYSQSSYAIAIQTTYDKLKLSFKNTQENVYIGKVKYIDYNTEYIPIGNGFYPYLHKRTSFKHERELRALVSKFPHVNEGESIFSKEVAKYGINIPIEIDTLIESVYVSPLASQWFVDLVQKLIDRYGYDISVINSRLSEEPIFNL